MVHMNLLENALLAAFFWIITLDCWVFKVDPANESFAWLMPFNTPSLEVD
jgi:hypothetical protein